MRRTTLLLLLAVLACQPALPARAELSFFDQAPPNQADDSQLQAAASKGNADAQYLLANILLVRAEAEKRAGHPSQSQILYRQAARWSHEAAMSGHARAMFYMGYLTREGLGTERSERDSLRWLTAAAEQKVPEAQYLLGVSALAGKSVSRGDVQRGAELLMQAGVGFLDAGRLDWAQATAALLERLAPGNSYSARLRQEIAKPERQKQAAAEGQSTGTGWVAPGGYVVTNQHVVASRRKISLALADGRLLPAKVAVVDEADDLVLLAVDDPCALPPAIPLAATEAGMGAQVFTIGFPLSTILGSSPKLSAGMVQGLAGGAGRQVLQVSAPVQHGNSGGPLVNLNGEAVGVVNAMLDKEGAFRATGEFAQNVSFAIRGEKLRALLDAHPPASRGMAATVKGWFGGQCPKELSAEPGTLEQTAARTAGSVLMILAE
jgi:S1-C subfamily serine protease